MTSSDDSLYSEAAYLVCIVLGRSCRIKTALYESSFTADLRKLYALGCNTLSSYSLLSDILSTSGLLDASCSSPAHLTKPDDASEACLQCSLAVVVHDLLLGSKRGAKHQVLMRQLASLTGDSHAFKKIRQAYHETRKQMSAGSNTKLDESQSNQQGAIDPVIKLPYYTLVNGLLTNLTEVVEELQSNGFLQRRHNPNTDSYHRFLKRVRKLKPNQFMLDHHLPDKLLVFPAGTSLHQLELYKSRRLIVQDKASCIPIEVLKPIYTADALDACAAPGNKTLQLVSALSPECTLFAVDRDPTRFRRLCSNLTASGVQRLSVDGPIVPDQLPNPPVRSTSVNQPRVEALCADFLALDPNDPRFSRVQSILLDPSCSGSGLTQRQPDGPDFTTLNKEKKKKNSKKQRLGEGDVADASRSEQPDQRLRRLANLQAQLLRHAFHFPNVQRVVYSTCSVNLEENERVVCELLDRFAGQFELEPIWQDMCEVGAETSDTDRPTPVWSNRGLEDCTPCIRSSSCDDLTNGFFVACFRRVHPTRSGTRKRPADITHSPPEKADAKRSHTAAQQSFSEQMQMTTKSKKHTKKKHKKHKKEIPS